MTLTLTLTLTHSLSLSLGYNALRVSQSVSPGGKWIPKILRLIGNCLFSFSLQFVPLI